MDEDTVDRAETILRDLENINNAFQSQRNQIKKLLNQVTEDIEDIHVVQEERKQNLTRPATQAYRTRCDLNLSDRYKARTQTFVEGETRSKLPPRRMNPRVSSAIQQPKIQDSPLKMVSSGKIGAFNDVSNILHLKQEQLVRTRLGKKSKGTSESIPLQSDRPKKARVIRSTGKNIRNLRKFVTK